MELPREYKQYHGISGDVIGVLNRSMYGMRDAASLWGKMVANVMKKLHFRQGASSPCIFWHPVRDLRTTVHGDNFSTLGTRLDLDWFEKQLAKEFTIKVEGILGPPGDPDVVHEIITLNRLLTWNEKGIEWEM